MRRKKLESGLPYRELDPEGFGTWATHRLFWDPCFGMWFGGFQEEDLACTAAPVAQYKCANLATTE